jgi:hypothetical protein
MGRHRRTKGFTVTAFQFTFMILFGTLGVLMVLAAELLGHHERGRHVR